MATSLGKGKQFKPVQFCLEIALVSHLDYAKRLDKYLSNPVKKTINSLIWVKRPDIQDS